MIPAACGASGSSAFDRAQSPRSSQPIEPNPAIQRIRTTSSTYRREPVRGEHAARRREAAEVGAPRRPGSSERRAFTISATREAVWADSPVPSPRTSSVARGSPSRLRVCSAMSASITIGSSSAVSAYGTTDPYGQPSCSACAVQRTPSDACSTSARIAGGVWAMGGLYRHRRACTASPPPGTNAAMTSTAAPKSASTLDPTSVAAALAALEARRDRTLADLIRLSKIPSVSARPVPDPDVRASAECVAELMRDAGLEGVELLELEGAHPYVLGHLVSDPALPTILLYAHHDVQPEGDPSALDEPAVRADPPRATASSGAASSTTRPASWCTSRRSPRGGPRTGACRSTSTSSSRARRRSAPSTSRRSSRAYRARMPADAIVLTDTGEPRGGSPLAHDPPARARQDARSSVRRATTTRSTPASGAARCPTR